MQREKEREREREREKEREGEKEQKVWVYSKHSSFSQSACGIIILMICGREGERKRERE